MKIFIFMKDYLKKYKLVIWIYFILGIILSVLVLFNPFLMGKIIDRISVAKNITEIYKFCMIFILSSIGAICIEYITLIMHTKLDTKISYNLQNNILQHIRKISLLKLKKYG